ncbi:hypothetical protein APS58_p00032 (plasmid) [Paracidovorax citrulli]|nr:hypothetical protein APS58_p00032 [Paracidovorax citrulli]
MIAGRRGRPLDRTKSPRAGHAAGRARGPAAAGPRPGRWPGHGHFVPAAHARDQRRLRRRGALGARRVRWACSGSALLPSFLRSSLFPWTVRRRRPGAAALQGFGSAQLLARSLRCAPGCGLRGCPCPHSGAGSLDHGRRTQEERRRHTGAAACPPDPPVGRARNLGTRSAQGNHHARISIQPHRPQRVQP